MAMTLEELRNQLSTIEINAGTFAGIGSSEVPLLEQLLQDNEAWMASRAVFALSQLTDRRAAASLSQAAADPRTEVRVSVAASLRNVDPSDANNILLTLLADQDVGVRKFAIQSVSHHHAPAVRNMLRDLQSQDPAAYIRQVAGARIATIGN